MSRLVLVFVLIGAALVGVVFLAQQYPQNLFIKFAEFIWTPDVITFGIWLIGLLVAAVAAFKLLIFLLQLPSELLAFSSRLSHKRSSRKLAEGITAYATGDYSQAADLLIHTKALAPNLHSAALLLAARCHSHQHNHKVARRLIHQARKGIPEDTPLDLLELEADMSDEFPDFTLRKLVQISERNPHNMRALDMLIRICSENNLWKEAGEVLLRKVQSAQFLNPQKRTEILRAVLKALLHDAAEKYDVQRVQWLYRNSERDLRETVKAEYARYLAIAGDVGKAEKILQPMIEKDWDAEAIACYSSVSIRKDPQRRLEQVKQWLTMHPNNPDLLAAAARLYRQCGLHAQASEHFEQSLREKADYRVWHEAQNAVREPKTPASGLSEN